MPAPRPRPSSLAVARLGARCPNATELHAQSPRKSWSSVETVSGASQADHSGSKHSQAAADLSYTHPQGCTHHLAWHLRTPYARRQATQKLQQTACKHWYWQRLQMNTCTYSEALTDAGRRLGSSMPRRSWPPCPPLPTAFDGSPIDVSFDTKLSWTGLGIRGKIVSK